MREPPSTDQPATQQVSSPVTHEPLRNVDARFAMCRPGVRRSHAADHSRRGLVGVKTCRFAPPPHGGANGLDPDSARAGRRLSANGRDSVGVQTGRLARYVSRRRTVRMRLAPSRGDAEVLFPTARGTRLSADAVEYLVAKYRTAAAKVCSSLEHKRITPHGLRHS
jgi:hypothetical protein